MRMSGPCDARVIVATALTLALLMPAAAPAASGPDPTGTWQRANGTQIRIAPCQKGMCGTIVFMRKPRTDTENPDPSLRNRPLVGLTILYDMVPARREAQWKGKVYNAENGKTYSGYITLIDADTMKLEGCILGGLACKGENWTRAR